MNSLYDTSFFPKILSNSLPTDVEMKKVIHNIGNCFWSNGDEEKIDRNGIANQIRQVVFSSITRAFSLYFQEQVEHKSTDIQPDQRNPQTSEGQ
jgi:hypothetical protein